MPQLWLSTVCGWASGNDRSVICLTTSQWINYYLILINILFVQLLCAIFAIERRKEKCERRRDKERQHRHQSHAERKLSFGWQLQMDGKWLWSGLIRWAVDRDGWCGGWASRVGVSERVNFRGEELAGINFRWLLIKPKLTVHPVHSMPGHYTELNSSWMDHQGVSSQSMANSSKWTLCLFKNIPIYQFSLPTMDVVCAGKATKWHLPGLSSTTEFISIQLFASNNGDNVRRRRRQRLDPKMAKTSSDIDGKSPSNCHLAFKYQQQQWSLQRLMSFQLSVCWFCWFEWRNSEFWNGEKMSFIFEREKTKRREKLQKILNLTIAGLFGAEALSKCK